MHITTFKNLILFTIKTIFLVTLINLSGCVTARIEDNRIGSTGISEGEGIVILAKSYHLGNDTETDFIKCVSSNVSSGSSSIRVVPMNEFKNTLFPWFEPRTAPSDTEGLARLLARSKVSNMISNADIKYIVWLDGNTDRAGGGGTMSCALGPAGAGCLVSRGGKMIRNMRQLFGTLRTQEMRVILVQILVVHLFCQP